MTDRRLHDVKDYVEMLSARADDVVSALYGVRAKGPRLQLGDVTGNRGQSLSIIMRHGVKPGCKPGDWRDFGTEEHGDILDLVAYAKYGGDKGEAIKWARGFLGIDAMDPKALAVELRRIETQKKQQEAAAIAAEQRRIEAARSIFLSGIADIETTPVDDYLLGRGIDIRLMPSTGACRFQPDCLLKRTGELLPAMVLAIVGADAKVSAVHRTYLTKKDGRWTNLRDDDGKSLRLALGPFSGGHVSVSKGSSGVPLGRAPQGDTVLIAEGYETAASYAIACPGLRVISAISLDNMGAVAVPPTVTTRLLVRENYMGEKTRAAFARVVEAHQKQCPDVRIVDTPSGFSDANDVLQGKRKAG